MARWPIRSVSLLRCVTAAAQVGGERTELATRRVENSDGGTQAMTDDRTRAAEAGATSEERPRKQRRKKDEAAKREQELVAQQRQEEAHRIEREARAARRSARRDQHEPPATQADGSAGAEGLQGSGVSGATTAEHRPQPATSSGVTADGDGEVEQCKCYEDAADQRGRQQRASPTSKCTGQSRNEAGDDGGTEQDATSFNTRLSTERRRTRQCSRSGWASGSRRRCWIKASSWTSSVGMASRQWRRHDSTVAAGLVVDLTNDSEEDSGY
ncbi:hypothetical protein PHYPSEUDO_010364 [Phytophthora pseudosyringae]|uniref:Uncharacterized protein n=1 Tax=Phytophthora pseudosyringae TaxID=221518 RepID=A0A8T1WCV7_9STRA|nr:hypothetical protein PHYPSEUDO_010364 [Phytophthora pseudosyringae]